MANEEHLAILKQGVEAWNKWRQKNQQVRPDLSFGDLERSHLSKINFKGADLRGARLNKADLSSSNLNRADLSRADCSEAKMDGVDLRGSNLSNACLLEAHLERANLTRVDLSNANLSWGSLRWANLTSANLRWTNLKMADLSNADLTNCILDKTDLQKAILNNCRVYGITTMDLKLENVKQSELIITERFEPLILVDGLEFARLIYLLLLHKEFCNVLDVVIRRGVLILGRFGGGGLEVLQAVAAKLREHKYLPIIFDFERPTDKDYTETVKTLVSLSRFVVVDLSGPSVPQELYAIVPHYNIPFVPIIEKGRKPHAMFKDLLKYSWVLGMPVEFETKEELMNLLPELVIQPAEEHFKERQAKLDELFPKRE